MKRLLACCVAIVFSIQLLLAAPKPHVVSFGKRTTVKWLVGEDESQPIAVQIRPLLVDGRPKEFTVGAAHDITERTFVVQRMYRVNDSLEQEGSAPRWRWERGGWLLVDRVSGKLQAIPLQGFDPYYSTVGWFREYAAYCGLSDDGKNLFALVSQLGKRKPLLKKLIGDSGDSDMPDSACSAPIWQRAPSRATFEPKHVQKFTYTVRSHAVDLVQEEDEPGEE